MDCSSAGSPIYGILQARILEWVAISFSRGFSQPRDGTVSLKSPALASGFFTTSATWEAPEYSQFSSVQSLSHVQLFVTPWTAACQTSLSITNFQSLLKLMSIELVMSSNHPINTQDRCNEGLNSLLRLPSYRGCPGRGSHRR